MQYGIDVDKLGTQIKKTFPRETTWGRKFKIAQEKEYMLERLDIRKGKTAILSQRKGWESTIFLEEGDIQINGKSLGRHRVMNLHTLNRIALLAQKDSVAYIFYGRPNKKRLRTGPRSTFDSRKKYWGTIETITNDLYTGKRLFFRKGKNSSLHFHVKKVETYFIHSGELLVRLRAGRGEDRFFRLTSGDTLRIAPGLMHQDGGLTDTVIIEISTHDEDSDSFIVEDGQKHIMPRLK